MTSSMIERVAQAMCKARHDEFNGWHELGEDERNSFRGDARAAIEEMREPTDAMLGAFDRLTDDSGSVLVKTGYRAMIDEALRD